MNNDDEMKGPGVVNEQETREQRTTQLVLGLVIVVAIIYAVTFFKLPVWLPALR